MPQFAIMRFAKHKGGAQGRLEAHHERKKEKYASNPDIRTDRSKHNLHLVRPALSYRQEIDSRIAAAGCKTRKDSVRFIDTMITASPEFFKGKKREEVRAYFDRAIDFLSRKIGRDNIFAAVVHLDEKTPHLHLCFTPITKDGRLSAKEIIGNKAALVKWQDDFFKHMVKSYPDLERGEAASVTGRRHVPTRVFKEAMHLTRQAERIREAIGSINPLNIGKKKGEVEALLQKFFPRMESFETQVRKYGREIERLEKENAALGRKANEKTSVKEQMTVASLQGQLQQLHRELDAIPAEYRQQFQPGKNTKRLEESL